MTCPSCGADNKPGRKFCVRCATPLALACPSCGAAADPGDAFCGDCAAPLTAGSPAALRASAAGPADRSQPAQVAERRLVSVLFADLVGFTPFAEGRDSEEVRETLSTYFDLASDIVGRYGGTVEKFIGDAVMAVWGTPVAHEDDAERAVRAALELVDAVPVLGPGIQARAGVLTGEAAVTIGATNQGMVAGDLVNTAARLQSVAPPGAVLVGEATHRAAGSAITFEPAGEHELKGKQAPVPAWRALRVVAERGGRGRADALEAPFVGRDDELRLVKDLFHATAREGRARLVSITGVGGIGKSRLAWEFEKYIDGILEPAWWHRGRSPAYGEGVTFWALSEMIRGRAGLAETDDEATTRAKVGELLAGLELDEPDRRWIESALLALLGVEAGIGAEQLFGAWRTFFERLAASGPVVLVFEDLHWADSGTLDFVDHLLDWSRAMPIYVVTLARPELLDHRPEWGSGRRNFTSIHVEPLGDSAMESLLRGLVPGLPDSVTGRVVARADGIPLYAVETVRMLLADGRLAVAGDGTYMPTGDLSELAVPETLTTLIAARLDALDPAARTVVMDAAVLGQTFALAALSAVSGIEEATLEPLLRGLVRRELFVYEADPRSPERGQYGFVQALIREVAYNTLAKRDRKLRHLTAARYFESLETDEIAAVLAGHYLAARENAPEGPEADALGVQAGLALRAAASRALALGANDQALALLEQALALATDPDDRAALLEQAGRAAAAAGRSEAGEGHLQAAIAARRSLGDRPGTASAIAALGELRNVDYRDVAAIALLEPAASEFADIAGDPAVIGIDAQLARSYFFASDLGRAIEVADRVLAAAERVQLTDVVADTLITKGTSLALVGRSIEGLALLYAGKALAEAQDDGKTTVRASTNLSLVLGHSDPRAAYEVARTGLVAARRLGHRGLATASLNNAVAVQLRVGDDWAWAVTEIDAALSDDPEAADSGAILGTAATFYALMGRPERDLVAALEAKAAAGGDTLIVGDAHWAAAFEAFAAGRLEDAREAWHRVAAVSDDLRPDAIPYGARMALWLHDAAGARDDLLALEACVVHGPAIDAARTTIIAGIDALEDRETTALAGYREALRAWRDLGLAWDEALCGLDMVMLLDRRDPEVLGAAASTREILMRLGAARMIEVLDAAMATTPAMGVGEPVGR